MTPGVVLVVSRSGHLVSWTESELLAEAPDAAKEVESRATQLAGGPERFRTLSDDQREVLTTQAAEELIRQQRGG